MNKSILSHFTELSTKVMDQTASEDELKQFKELLEKWNANMDMSLLNRTSNNDSNE